MKEVSQDELYKFIESYPSNLDIDVCGIGEPPVKSYNDFTLGKWPDSVVASCKVFPDDPYYTDVMKGYKLSPNGNCFESNWTIKA